MAKGGRKKFNRRKKVFKKDTKDEAKIQKQAKDRERKLRKSKSLTRQMRGMKWDEEEYGEEFEEELENP